MLKYGWIRWGTTAYQQKMAWWHHHLPPQVDGELPDHGAWRRAVGVHGSAKIQGRRLHLHGRLVRVPLAQVPDAPVEPPHFKRLGPKPLPEDAIRAARESVGGTGDPRKVCRVARQAEHLPRVQQDSPRLSIAAKGYRLAGKQVNG